MVTKTNKNVILFTNMRIQRKHVPCQLLSVIHCFLIIVFLSVLSACSARKDEVILIPPVTSPLSKDYIGFGVITSSFTHITATPEENSPSNGYLRRGSLVKIMKRQTIRTQSGFVTWVLINSASSGLAEITGWLKEELIDIYDSESQARTASEFILR
jgi:hypothetical protein